jgi:quercetin dioxygenase-like cupin family protein
MTDDQAGSQPIRRVVTGHGQDQIAKVIFDSAAENVKRPVSGISSTTLWTSTTTPADISIGEKVEDFGNLNVPLAPPENGTRFAIVEFLPGNGAFMHRTETLDYVIVLSGELEMQMDNSTVNLKAGDVVVQRGTNHSWSNKSAQPARIGIVLVDGKSLGIGKPLPRASV